MTAQCALDVRPILSTYLLPHIIPLYLPNCHTKYFVQGFDVQPAVRHERVLVPERQVSEQQLSVPVMRASIPGRGPPRPPRPPTHLSGQTWNTWRKLLKKWRTINIAGDFVRLDVRLATCYIIFSSNSNYSYNYSCRI